jgi:hypothetical protein
MDSNSEEELRKELEATKRKLYDEKMSREAEEAKAETKAWAREQKASANTASIVFFGAIAIIFLLAIMGVS